MYTTEITLYTHYVIRNETGLSLKIIEPRYPKNFISLKSNKRK